MRFKKLAPRLLLSSALLASLFTLAQNGAAAATLVVDDNLACPGATFTTISSAVVAASPGDTIKVCAGTYTETVTINKTLTLLGAQSGVDAASVSRTGLPATESVVNGPGGGFSVNAADVVIDGFTVQGAAAPPLGTGIYTSPSFGGYKILNNIIQNNTFGLYLNSSGVGQTVVRDNYFKTNNQPGAASGDAIYSDQGLSDALIDSNNFTGHTSAAMVFAGNQTFITVSNNQLISDSSIVFFNTTGPQVIGNRIVGSLGSAIYLGGGVDGLVVKCNTIMNSTGSAIRLQNLGGPTNSNIIANDNNIQGNAFGIRLDPGTYFDNGGALPFDATNNWWGSPTGPTTPTNPGGTGDSIIDPDGVVVYVPFRTAPVPDADSDGTLDSCDAQVGPPTAKDQCKNGGWQNFNSPRTFKNQGDCIQFVNTGK